MLPSSPCLLLIPMEEIAEKTFSLKANDCEKELLVSFALGAPQAHGHRLVHAYMHATAPHHK